MALIGLSYFLSILIAYTFVAIYAIQELGPHGHEVLAFIVLLGPIPLGYLMTLGVPFVRKSLAARGLAAPLLGLAAFGAYIKFVLM